MLKKKILKIVRIVLITLAPIIVILFLLMIIMGLMTRNSNKVFSQDGQYFTKVEEVNGGATTSYQTDVSIVNAKYLFSNSVFLSAWSGNSKSVFAFNGDLDSVKTLWVDNNTLKIIYKDCSKIYGKPDKTWKDIKIVYEGKCSEDN